MDEIFIKRAAELSLAVYRVTGKFPEKEVLRERFRGLSIDILEFLCYVEENPTIASRFFNWPEFEVKIKKFNAYSRVASEQGWANPLNFEVLEREYVRFVKDLKEYQKVYIKDARGRAIKYKEERNINRIFPKKTATNQSITERAKERQDSIFKILKKKKRPMSKSEVAKRMKASRKTAERHLKGLVERGLISKHGSKRDTKFFIP